MAKVYLKNERAQIHKAVASVEGLDKQMTTCFKTEVKRDEQLWKELQDSVYKESHLNTNLQTLTERVDRLEQGQRQKNVTSRKELQNRIDRLGRGAWQIGPQPCVGGLKRSGRKESVDKH